MARVTTYLAELKSREEIANHHNDVVESLMAYFAAPPPERFVGFLPAEIDAELQKRLEEQGKQSSLILLAHLEARWRTDYDLRCENKAKDSLSRQLRELRRTRGKNVSFEDDLIRAWIDNDQMSKALGQEVKGAFKFRHWLAHGRHWEPDLGRKYDYIYLYDLVTECDPIFRFS